MPKMPKIYKPIKITNVNPKWKCQPYGSGGLKSGGGGISCSKPLSKNMNINVGGQGSYSPYGGGGGGYIRLDVKL